MAHERNFEIVQYSEFRCCAVACLLGLNIQIAFGCNCCGVYKAELWKVKYVKLCKKFYMVNKKLTKLFEGEQNAWYLNEVYNARATP